MPSPLIILGASARAAAQSAIRAGFAPWCIDLFADRDLRTIAPVQRCPWDEYPLGVLRLLERADAPPAAPVLVVGAMENHPRVLEAIALTRELRGSSPEAVQAVRDPLALPSIQPTGVLRICRTVASRGLRASFRLMMARWFKQRLLIKPRRSAGGHGIRFASPQDRLDEDEYLQQYIEGTPLAAVFASNGWSVRLLGVTEQLIGDEHLGTSGFRYCGNIGPIDTTPEQREAMNHLGVVLAQRFDLRGVFGVDLIRDQRGQLWPIEINPRYTASVEVIEQATGLACLHDWPIPPPPKRPAGAPPMLRGKGIVFARREKRMPDLYDLFDPADVADVPEAGAKVKPGQPICTVFAAGTDMAAVRAQLHERAARVYEGMERG